MIRDFGGLGGIRDLALLESAIAIPAIACFGVELHPSLYDKAAAYLFHIVKNHPFVDGNKRTAITATLIFLLDNGEKPHYDANALTEFVVCLAKGEKTHEDIRHCIEIICRRHPRTHF